MKTRSRDFACNLTLDTDSALTVADYDRALHAVKCVDVYDAHTFLLGPDCAGFIGECITAPAANDRRRLRAAEARRGDSVTDKQSSATLDGDKR